MEKYFIYHIPNPMYPDNIMEGYIGRTSNVEGRFNKHAKSNSIVGQNIRKHNISFSAVNILFSSNSQKEVYNKENELRPLPDIGWNSSTGGYRQDRHGAYSRALMSSVKKSKTYPENHNRLSDEQYKKNSLLQKGISRKKYECCFCKKFISDGNIQRWHNANCKLAPKQTTFINGFDIDGVVYLGELGGLYPGPNDVLITGRSFEEKPETIKMLNNRGIYNQVYFNPIKFDNKSRKSSGEHKAKTIIELFKSGVTIQVFFEDDYIQYIENQKILKAFGIKTKLVWVNHGGLIPLENVRHLL